MASRLIDRLRRARAGDPATFRVRVWLALAAALLLAQTVFGDSPFGSAAARRVRSGIGATPIDYVHFWAWWTALAILPLVVALLATAPRWLGWGPVRESPEFAPAASGRIFAALVLLAMLACGLLAAPRLSMSLFEDETIAVHDAIDGRYQLDRDGKVRFHAKPWRATIWWYKEPDNHIVQSVLSRASLEVWRAFARPTTHFPSETALRVPAWLAGIAAVGALALLLRRMGHPREGVVAAWLLALHPWHLRYTSEARGYSLLILLCPLAIWALWAALERGTWRRWSAYGACQFLAMWNYPAIVYFFAVLSPVAALLVWRQQRGTPFRRQQLWRWAMVNLVGGLLFTQLMTGNLVQLPAYLAHEHNGHHHMEMGAPWYRDLATYLALGIDWGPRGMASEFWDLDDAFGQMPWLWGAALAAISAAAAAGALRLARRGLARGLVALVLVLPPLLALAVTAATRGFLFPQYLIFALPGVVLLVALGATWPLERLGPRTAVVGSFLLVAAFAAVSEPPRHQYQTRPLEPFRESVLLTRPTLDPLAPANERILTVSFSWPPEHYDPRVHTLTSPDQLRHWMRVADRTGEPLYVNIGEPNRAYKKYPGFMAIVDDETRFERIAYLPAIFHRGNREVWRYRGRAARAKASRPASASDPASP